jgi:hypothetical protein
MSPSSSGSKNKPSKKKNSLKQGGKQCLLIRQSKRENGNTEPELFFLKAMMLCIPLEVNMALCPEDITFLNHRCEILIF